MSSPEATTEEAETEVVETDELRESVVATFTEELGDAVLGTHIRPGDDVWIRVDRAAWVQAGYVLRDHLDARAFGFLSAIDWLPSPYGKNEDSPTDPPPEIDSTIVTGYAGGDTRFQVFARAHSHSRKVGVTLKTDIPDDDLVIDSWIPVYAGVNWHERELSEMFGIDVRGHGNLVNIYLPGEFEGHPLRKDFPLLARHVKPWPGLVDIEPMPEAPAPPDDAPEAEADAATDTDGAAEPEASE